MNPDSEENIIKESEARFRSYFNMPLNGIAITSPEKGWLEVNDKICSMLGYTREEILKMNWAEMTHPDDIKADEEQFNKILSGEIDQYGLSKRFIRKDKTIIWTNLSVGCIRRSDNSVDYFVALIVDTTEQKKLSELIIQEKKEQEIILDSIPACIFYKDKKNNLIKVNKTFADRMGISKKELEGKSFFDIYPKDQADKFLKDDIEVIESGKSKINIIEQVTLPDGVMWAKTDIIPYKDADNKIIGVIGFTIDITEQKVAEMEIKNRLEETEKLNQIMIGRELKMSEIKEEDKLLKQRIVSLENEK